MARRALLQPFYTPWQPSLWIAAALHEAFAASIDVQRKCIHDLHSDADVLVGSSWGGAVAAALLAQGAWAGPTVILCPAVRLIDRWPPGVVPAFGPNLTHAGITAGLASLSPSVKARCLLVHGCLDETVPISDSRELSSRTGISLYEVDDGDHGLGSVAQSGLLLELLQRVMASSS